MRLTLKQMIEEMENFPVYSERLNLSNNRRVRYLDYAQAELQDAIETHVMDGARLFVAQHTITLDGSASYILPPNLKGIEYVEFSADNDSWVWVMPRTLGDRMLYDGVTNSTLYPTSGYLRVWYSRRLPSLFQGVPANETGSTTSVTLPTTPTRSADGAVSGIDDYYNSAILDVISDTTVQQSSTITDYVGSTRVATVSFASAVSDSDEICIRCEIPEEYHMLVVWGALKLVVPNDQDLQRMYAEGVNRMISQLPVRRRDLPLFGRGDDERYEAAGGVSYHLWGNTIRLVEV